MPWPIRTSLVDDFVAQAKIKKLEVDVPFIALVVVIIRIDYANTVRQHNEIFQ